MFAGAPGVFCAGNDIADFLAAAGGGGLDPRAPDFLTALARANPWSPPSAASPSASAPPCCSTATTSSLPRDATLSTPFFKLALIPEAASTLLAPRRMGYARAFSLLAMGRPLSAAEAKEAGLVNAVVHSVELDSRCAEGGAARLPRCRRARWRWRAA